MPVAKMNSRPRIHQALRERDPCSSCLVREHQGHNSFRFRYLRPTLTRFHICCLIARLAKTVLRLIRSLRRGASAHDYRAVPLPKKLQCRRSVHLRHATLSFGCASAQARYWQRPRYLGLASIIVINLGSSHEDASHEFHPRQYVVAPLRTPYPPEPHDVRSIAAVSRESCIVYAQSESCQSPQTKKSN